LSLAGYDPDGFNEIHATLSSDRFLGKSIVAHAFTHIMPFPPFISDIPVS